MTEAYLIEKQWSQSISSIFTCEREKALYDRARASVTPLKNCKVFITPFISHQKRSCSTFHVPHKYILRRAKNSKFCTFHLLNILLICSCLSIYQPPSGFTRTSILASYSVFLYLFLPSSPIYSLISSMTNLFRPRSDGVTSLHEIFPSIPTALKTKTKIFTITHKATGSSEKSPLLTFLSNE